MKKITTISFLFFLCAISGYAQEIIYIPSPDSIVEPGKADSTIEREYSLQNLQHASQQDLTIYLKKASKLKRKGGILSIVGSASSVAGFALAGYAYTGGTYGMFMFGTLIFVGGIGTTLVGIPKWITGSIRVNKTIDAINKHTDSRLNIAPSFVFDSKTQNLYPGITLRGLF
jgi:hypothetical protein